MNLRARSLLIFRILLSFQVCFFLAQFVYLNPAFAEEETEDFGSESEEAEPESDNELEQEAKKPEASRPKRVDGPKEEGTRALDRFEMRPDQMIKSKYKRQGASLEVDPD